MWVKPGTYTDNDGKPDQPLLIRLPHSRRIMPPEGMEIDATDFFWARLLRDKDVVPAAPPPPADQAPSQKL
jgi:hypothetical protein